MLSRRADRRRLRPDNAVVDLARRWGEHDHRGVPPADADEGEHVEVPVPVAHGHVPKPERHVALLITDQPPDFSALKLADYRRAAIRSQMFPVRQASPDFLLVASSASVCSCISRSSPDLYATDAHRARMFDGRRADRRAAGTRAAPLFACARALSTCSPTRAAPRQRGTFAASQINAPPFLFRRKNQTSP